MAAYGISGKQIFGRFGFSPSELAFPFLLGTGFLVAVCAMQVAGRITVTRNGDRLSIFSGVGSIGWTWNYRWSEFSSVREDYVGAESADESQHGSVLALEGKRRVRFGSKLSGPRRRYVLEVLRAMLNKH